MTDDPSWPFGSGETARLVREHDWAGTPLGPSVGWPEGLRAVVALMLAGPVVSTLVVGPGRILLYNDAAARLCGRRHPGGLGRRLPDAFPDGCPAVAPLYDRAFAGEAVQVAGQRLDVSQAGARRSTPP